MTPDDRSPDPSRALIDAARATDDPSPCDRSRVLAKLTATVGAGAAIGMAEKTSAANGGIGASGAVGGLGLKSIGWLTALTLTAGGGALWLERSQLAERPEIAPPAPSHLPDKQLPNALPTAPAPVPAVAAPKIDGTPTPKARPARPVTPLKPARPLQPMAAAPAVSTSSEATGPSAAEAVQPSPMDQPAPPSDGPSRSAALPLTAASAPLDSPDRAAATSRATSNVPTRVTRQPPPPSAASIAGELRLLGEAQRALADGQFARALAALDRHAARYPNGSLSEERSAARAAALCRLQRNGEGERELVRLAERAPDSPLLFWARGYCRPERPR